LQQLSYRLEAFVGRVHENWDEAGKSEKKCVLFVEWGNDFEYGCVSLRSLIARGVMMTASGK
jgi:hypothetical protein